MLNVLPLEIIIKILLFCDIKSILSCLQLNKALKAISLNQYFWNLMLIAHYSFTPPNKQDVPLIAIFKSFTHFQNNRKDWDRFFLRIQGDQKLHFLVITDVKGSCLKLAPVSGRLEDYYKTQLPGSIANISQSFAGTLVPIISVPLENLKDFALNFQIDFLDVAIAISKFSIVKIKSDARRYRRRFINYAVQTIYKEYAEGKPCPLPERRAFQNHFDRKMENKVRRRMEEWRRAYEFEKIATWFH